MPVYVAGGNVVTDAELAAPRGVARNNLDVASQTARGWRDRLVGGSGQRSGVLDRRCEPRPWCAWRGEDSGAKAHFRRCDRFQDGSNHACGVEVDSMRALAQKPREIRTQKFFEFSDAMQANRAAHNHMILSRHRQ